MKMPIGAGSVLDGIQTSDTVDASSFLSKKKTFNCSSKPGNFGTRYSLIYPLVAVVSNLHL
jgi:hypothetical protein